MSSALLNTASTLPGTYGVRTLAFSACACSMAASRVVGSGSCAATDLAAPATRADIANSLQIPAVHIVNQPPKPRCRAEMDERHPSEGFLTRILARLRDIA